MASLWHQGWKEAHGDHVPAELHAARTLDSFRIRLEKHLPNARTSGPVGAPHGLCIVKGEYLDQLYIAPSERGTGLAARLLADAETRIRESGHTQARLTAIAENHRALAFYQKHGWTISTTEPVELETLGDPFRLDCHVLTKSL